MGWSGIYTKKNRPLNAEEIQEFFKNEFGNCEIIDQSVQGKEAYFVVKCPGVLNGKNFALVVLIDNKPGEFSYKEMDETMGPYYYKAPIRLLEKLDPIESEQANEWRQKCWKRHGKRYAQPEGHNQTELFS